jgi:uncharacterized protein
MALVRILVDGYSFLHSCPEIAPGKARYSATAREELIDLLTRYRDASGTPITVVFDGAGAPPGTPELPSNPEMEVLFSPAGSTADDLIERAAHRLREYGEALVVTDDVAERETIMAMGNPASSCLNFMEMIRAALQDFDSELARYNRREMARFKHRPS